MPQDGTILGRRTGWLTDTGTVLALAALVLPVLVLTAALGFGAATVRAAANETQRTADLAAVAAAATLPTLGRPDPTTGLPKPDVTERPTTRPTASSRRRWRRRRARPSSC